MELGYRFPVFLRSNHGDTYVRPLPRGFLKPLGDHPVDIYAFPSGIGFANLKGARSRRLPKAESMSDPIHSNSLGDDEARPNKTKLKTRETRIPGRFKPMIGNVILQRFVHSIMKLLCGFNVEST
jgi:hypothetical protein